ncbi:hypothetical protein AB0K60_20700 [Thermopolyspora sp. NPDC052614]|uniref:hypothetical protein n=1 Tax=Thermopolyspora sp. NPDC052614 TaxID=3155682 RepID=UPI00341F08AE
MSKLTNDEREDLARIVSSPELNDPRIDGDRRLGQQFADLWRADLDDVDEVTIGRVLLRAAVAVTQLTDAGLPTARVANILTLCAVDLTALELGKDLQGQGRTIEGEIVQDPPGKDTPTDRPGEDDGKRTGK